MTCRGKNEAWELDQLLKSKLFHAKLHEWGLLEIAAEIEDVRGEELSWTTAEERCRLNISESAWNKVIHRGIKPVRVFAHPQVLLGNPRRVGYYRMLAMVSQKSMSNIGLPVEGYETGKRSLDEATALALAKHFNKIISTLVDEDQTVDEREFDLWRGMAAGSQAQGTWQNVKGIRAEQVIKDLIEERLRNKGLVMSAVEDKRHKVKEFVLYDGRQVKFGKDPDIAVNDASGVVQVAVEIKGGIDMAGVLERLGATMKSLVRAKRKNPQSRTILVLPSAAVTVTFQEDALKAGFIDLYFVTEMIINDVEERQKFFHALGL